MSRTKCLDHAVVADYKQRPKTLRFLNMSVAIIQIANNLNQFHYDVFVYHHMPRGFQMITCI